MTKVWQKGYKVVREFEGALRSCSDMGMPITYKLRRITKRPDRCGPLALFRHEWAARYFGTTMSFGASKDQFIVVECQYAPSVDRKLWNDLGMVLDWPLPLNTVLADKVKLLRKICVCNRKELA